MLDKLRLAPRLAMGFALVIVVMSIAAGIGIWRLENLRKIADELGGVSAERALLARELHSIVVLSSLRAETLLMTNDPAYAARINADRKITSARSEAVRKRLEELSDSERGREVYRRIDEAGERFRAARAALVKRKESGATASSDELQRDLRPTVDSYAAAVDEFAEYEKQRVTEARKAAVDSAAAGRDLLIAGMIVGASLGGWLAWAISRSIVAPLLRASTLAGRVAEGDLTGAPLLAQGRDEVQVLSADLSTMQTQLAALVRDIQQISDSVATASGEIASGNTDLSQRTEETASSLQQTASSMEQLNGAVRQSADAASQANELAASACTVASRGGEVVSQVVTTMSEINTSSKKIADIIGVIDGIAFQTNILALNAAVEAARAGEQGRGFAVVAGEVRSLAQRSAEAAKEIKTLIGASVDRVESGSRLVEAAGTTMGDIVASVQRVRDIIGEISVAASEQRTGIGQIATSVNQLDQMTQQNAALVEQSAAAAESLREHATRLASTVQTFRIAGQPALAGSR
jgi:methyl-accepting chemotaxis protein